MRRLPVYLLIDTSGSMHGEPIEAVKNGISVLVSSLRQNPYALETAYLSIITFDSTARQIVPLTELTAFQMPEIRATGATAFGDALRLLAQCADTEIVKTTPETKGDWKPIVFIMTDGRPTDDWENGLSVFNRSRFGCIVACGAGQGADLEALKKTTENVLHLDTADQASIAAFFKWVSASIGASSQKVDTAAKEVTGLDQLPPPPPEINVII